jgi:hypothetical protein
VILDGRIKKKENKNKKKDIKCVMFCFAISVFEKVLFSRSPGDCEGFDFFLECSTETSPKINLLSDRAGGRG